MPILPHPRLLLSRLMPTYLIRIQDFQLCLYLFDFRYIIAQFLIARPSMKHKVIFDLLRHVLRGNFHFSLDKNLMLPIVV